MSAIIVQSSTFLTLLGGGPTHFSHVKQALKRAPILVAADGGAELALTHALPLTAIIGDMDSILPATRAAVPPELVYHIAEQDSTDFAKCLRSIEAPAILALGFTGGRVDHQLAACTTLVNFPDKTVLMLSEEDVCFLCPAEFEINLPRATRFSLYPMAEMQGTSEGLEYPIDGLTLSPATRVGTSNAVTGPVRLTFQSRDMLVIVPLDCLDIVLAALVTA